VNKTIAKTIDNEHVEESLLERITSSQIQLDRFWNNVFSYVESVKLGHIQAQSAFVRN